MADENGLYPKTHKYTMKTKRSLLLQKDAETNQWWKRERDAHTEYKAEKRNLPERGREMTRKKVL